MPSQLPAAAHSRLAMIEAARRSVLHDAAPAHDVSHGPALEPWIERSWRRCLSAGREPGQHLAFDMVPEPARRRVAEASHELVQAARPTLDRLSRAIANTRYFAILTNHEGVVIDAHGPIDRSDRRADLITRIGVDLSERAVGTSAIGAALAELQPVWLHRGEHFFADTSIYSCAGAPLFGPDGRCVGMLDLTGIDAAERPELRHLVAQSARSIENTLAIARPHSLLVRLNWPGRAIGDDSDGLLCLDAEGWVTASNAAARQMMSQLSAAVAPVHCSELFALPWEQLFDAASHEASTGIELPLWSGLRLQALPLAAGQSPARAVPARPMALKELETSLIRKAVSEARGNVAQAAQALGISRATVYRKLGRK